MSAIKWSHLDAYGNELDSGPSVTCSWKFAAALRDVVLREARNIRLTQERCVDVGGKVDPEAIILAESFEALARELTREASQ